MLIHIGRVCYGPTLLCTKSLWMAISCSTLFSIHGNYQTCHLHRVIVHMPFQMKKVLCEVQMTPFYVHGPSLTWAEFVMGRDCNGPSLLWAEMSRNLCDLS